MNGKKAADRLILLTGATGYVGGRLLRALEEGGRRVRCMTRRPEHLQARVGEILRRSGVPTIEFRASIIIGSGSLSFEMIRALVNRLPVMTTPRWVCGAAAATRSSCCRGMRSTSGGWSG